MVIKDKMRSIALDGFALKMRVTQHACVSHAWQLEPQDVPIFSSSIHPSG